MFIPRDRVLREIPFYYVFEDSRGFVFQKLCANPWLYYVNTFYSFVIGSSFFDAILNLKAFLHAPIWTIISSSLAFTSESLQFGS